MSFQLAASLVQRILDDLGEDRPKTARNFILVCTISKERRLSPSYTTMLNQCSFLQQQDSWDRIQITFYGFLLLLDHFSIFSAFFDLVQGFGLKFEPRDENYTGFRSQLLPDHEGNPS